MSITLAKYKKRILAKEDKLLFTEVEKCAKAGAYRAAYILTWIACAESFKRRFREAAIRDHNANGIVAEIQNKESQKKAVDYYVLNKAEEYGFINLAVKSKLENILNFRSVYAHPYEDAPSEEELINAISIIINDVLSQPVRLKHGFIASQMKEVFENPQFLDDLKDSVTDYADEILPRISEDLYSYMLEKVFQEVETNIGDPSMRIFTRRGSWISMSLISKCLPTFSTTEWHALVNKYPQIAPYVLSNPDFFSQIGKKAQDSLVSHILSGGKSTPSTLTLLEQLLEGNVLSDRHKERFLEFIDKFELPYHSAASGDKLNASGLKLKTCFSSIIAHLKSHDWYVQNPISIMISNAGPHQINELDDNQQQELGRNILQSSNGGATQASALLDLMSENANAWPYQFIYGVLIECFVNEKNQFRFKIRRLEQVCEIFETLEDEHRAPMLEELLSSIDKSEMKRGDDDDLEECLKTLEGYKWSETFCSKLEPLVKKKINEKQKAKAA